jgi:uncharacterized paraquat-inducible protein A
MNTGPLTGITLGLASCDVCGLLYGLPTEFAGTCPHAGKSWRFENITLSSDLGVIIAAAICYIPANCCGDDHDHPGGPRTGHHNSASFCFL